MVFAAISFALCNDARRATVGDDHLLDGRVEQDIDAGFPAGASHCLGDRAHAANRVAPCARHSGGFAEQMVKKDVGGARRLRRGEIADDAVEAEQRLGEVAFEVAVEDFGSAAHREIVDGARFGEAQARHVAAEAQELRNRADLPPDVGRRAQ